MKYILPVIIALFVLLGNLFSAIVDPNTGWSYIQSDLQTFYLFIDPIEILDEEEDIDLANLQISSNGNENKGEEDVGSEAEKPDV